MRNENSYFDLPESAAEWSITRREFLKRSSSAAAAAAALVGSVSPWSLLAAEASASPVGGLCTGTITDKGTGRPISGVLVSDGARIVRTARDGRYALKVAPHIRPIVYVTVPDGYRLNPDAFWQPAKFNAGKAAADFSLTPRERVRKFMFVQVADTHHFKTTHSPQDIASFIKAAHGLKPAPEFVIATGDLPMGVDGVEKLGFHRLDKCLSMYDGFVDVFKPLKLPMLKVIGNHDCAICLPKHLPEHHKGLYRRYFGPLNYSFDYGDIHFVALDANIDAGPIIKPGRWIGPYEVIDKTALAWLARDLAFQPKGKPIVLFTHQPPQGQKNFDRLVEILRPHNFRAAFAGHWHTNNTLQSRTHAGLGPFIVTGALYGSWSGRPCQDGTWRGYRVIAIDGQDVRSCYAAIDKPFQGAVLNVNVRRSPQHRVSGKIEVLTDILDIDHKLTGVGCAINNGPAVAMTSKRRTEMWTRWRAVIDTTRAADGPGKLVFTPRTAGGKQRYEFYMIVKNARVTLLHPEAVAVA